MRRGTDTLNSSEGRIPEERFDLVMATGSDCELSNHNDGILMVELKNSHFDLMPPHLFSQRGEVFSIVQLDHPVVEIGIDQRLIHSHGRGDQEEGEDDTTRHLDENDGERCLGDL